MMFAPVTTDDVRLPSGIAFTLIHCQRERRRRRRRRRP
jgi:hypothetical protein